MPLQLGRPLWVDDPHFHLGYHLRHTALASPGGDRELRNLVGRVMAQHLDRHKPLWEMWMVEGLGPGPLGARVEGAPLHGRRRLRHRSADRRARSRTRTGERPCPTCGSRRASPATRGWYVDALIDLVASPYEQLRAARASTRAPRQMLRSFSEVTAWPAGVDGCGAPDAVVDAQRPDRPAPPLGLGPHDARRREDGATRARRHGERRRADRAHPRLSGSAAVARRRCRRSRRADAGAGVGTHPG